MIHTKFVAGTGTFVATKALLYLSFRENFATGSLFVPGLRRSEAAESCSFFFLKTKQETTSPFRPLASNLTSAHTLTLPVARDT